MKSLVANNIKNIIKENGIIQKRVAEKAGFSPKSFNAMLNGRKTIKDIDIPPIAKALGVTPNELFGITENTKPA